jgi:hypothetical protein
MTSKLGRNARCHCGSGKKYKYCHLSPDSVQRRVIPEKQAEPPPPAPAVTAAASLEQTVRALEELKGTGSDKQKDEVGKLLARAAPLNAYLSREAEIQAAALALESHQEEFSKFVEDKTAYQDQVELLFAEDRFACSRFGVEDLQRAFDQLGSPLGVAKEKLAEHCGRVIL